MAKVAVKLVLRKYYIEGVLLKYLARLNIFNEI